MIHKPLRVLDEAPANRPGLEALRVLNYGLDYEAISRRNDPILEVELLVDCVSDPAWDRDKQLCAKCEGWTDAPHVKEGEQVKPKDRPSRPGTPDPLLGCSGCWFADLDKLARPVIITRPGRRSGPRYLGAEGIQWDYRRRKIMVAAVGWEKREAEPEMTRQDLQPFRAAGSLREAYLARPWGQREAPGRPWDMPEEAGDWFWAAWLRKWLWVPQKLKGKR